jgi:Zn-dependent oligopeptidase
MIKHFIETNNYPEIYNCYAMWIQTNKHYFQTGGNPVKLSFEQVTKPFGFRSFLKESISNEKELIKIEQDCSEYLGKYPEDIKVKADLFTKTFPRIILEKINKKAKREMQQQVVVNKKLTEFFEQPSLPLIKTNKLSDIAETICAFAERGAKTVKSPDGWEVQF